MCAVTDGTESVERRHAHAGGEVAVGAAADVHVTPRRQLQLLGDPACAHEQVGRRGQRQWWAVGSAEDLEPGAVRDGTRRAHPHVDALLLLGDATRTSTAAVALAGTVFIVVPPENSVGVT